MKPHRLALTLETSRSADAGIAFSGEARALLNHFRLVALDCRAKPRADLFEACALLTLDKQQARSAHAEALMRCLRTAMGRQPVMYRPGETEISFDEAWLLRLALSVTRGDEPSTAFLLASRVRPEDWRHLRFLMHAISTHHALS